MIRPVRFRPVRFRPVQFRPVQFRPVPVRPVSSRSVWSLSGSSRSVWSRSGSPRVVSSRSGSSCFPFEVGEYRAARKQNRRLAFFCAHNWENWSINRSSQAGVRRSRQKCVPSGKLVYT